MPPRRRTEPQEPPSRRRQATTPEGVENQMISMAMDLAQRRMEQGIASAQEIVHFLKLGSSREHLEQARLAGENKLLAAKADQIAQQGDMRELMNEAIIAMRGYQGTPTHGDESEDED